METKWVKKLTLPVLAMLFIYYATREDSTITNVVNTISNQTPQEQIVYTSEDYYVVYALHESDNLVKTYVEKGEEQDPIHAIFDVLTTKSNQLPAGTTSLISPMTTLNDYKLDNGVLTLDLSADFLDYTTEEEQDLLSSLVWTYTELADVDKVKFEIDGESVNNLNGALSVGRGLDRSMGINLELDTTNYDETQLVTLYFVTDDSQEGLLVPVTRLISASTDPITYAVSALIQGPVNENYMELLVMIDALKRASAKEINVIMPYYGYSRQDRKAAPRQPISAKLMADLIQTAGATRLMCLDLHADQIQGFFNIPIDNFLALSILAEYFIKKDLEDKGYYVPNNV